MLVMKRSLLIVYIFSLLLATSPVALAQQPSCQVVDGDDVPKSILEERLLACEAEIAAQNALIEVKQREATTLERDIDIIGHQVSKAQAEIKSRNLSIQKLGGEITNQESALSELEKKTLRMRSSTGELLRRTRELDERSFAEIILSGTTLSDAVIDHDTFAFVEQSLHETFDELRLTQNLVTQHKETLEEQQSEEARLKGLREIEKRRAEGQQEEKDRLLSMTKEEEQAYQEVLRQKQIIAAQIKNKILRLTGGGELRFEDALTIAKVAEMGTGVRSAFILAILTQESGLNGIIGANLGRCTYNQSWGNAAGTVMSNSQKPAFLAITRELGLDPDTVPVSCPINSDGQYGGAMGPSQFMPRTWWDEETGTGYKKRIAKSTGNNPPSPWVNVDAFTGTAHYLLDALTGCRATYSSLAEQESCSAGKYYAGGNWKRFMGSYGASVARRADEFQKDIDFLESQLN